MNRITIDLSDETVHAMNVPAEEVGTALRMAAAVKLYELGRLSSGAAAALAGVARITFLEKLADYGVDTFNLSEEQLAKETRLA